VTSPPHGGTVPRPTTTDELRKMCVLSICDDYDDDRLAELLAEPDALTALLSIPRRDAVHVLAGVLPQQQRIEWAQASARRAAEYAAYAADAADAAYAADAAVHADADAAAYSAAAAAVHAAYSAAAAAVHAAGAAATAATADYCSADDARDAEYETAIRHAVQLLGW